MSLVYVNFYVSVCECTLCNFIDFVVVLIFFFFFKQKTAYEMRISDWSSDVCSSDLCAALYQGRSPPSGRHVTQMVWDEKCLRRGASPSFGRNGVQGVITRSETASLRVLAL